jgi:hypothetical protein
MRDLRRHWQEIRTIESNLPRFVWLASVEDSQKCIVEVAAAQAARLLHAKSHRLAMEEEIHAYWANVEAAKRLDRLDGLRRQGIAIVSIG